MHLLTQQTDCLIPLDWDTARLGVKTGKMQDVDLDLPRALFLAKSQGYQLLYWQTPGSEQYAQIAKEHGGILTDHKVTYLTDLHTLNKCHLRNEIAYPVESYSADVPSEELITLAYESGKYSRFRNDPNLSESQFQAVYKEWIKNSANRSIAQDILIIKDSADLLGFATVGEKNQRGDVGLLAVSEKARKKHVGSSLVKAAQHYFLQSNLKYSQIVTQQQNIPACKLYEKCGYHVEKVEFFFHFWV